VLVLPCCVAAQKVHPPNVSGAAVSYRRGLILMVETIDLEVSVTGPDGGAIEEAAVVTVMKSNGQFYRQGTTKKAMCGLTLWLQPNIRYK